MLRAIKIRLYLDVEQELYCNRLLGSSRFVYNKCLEHRIQKYNEDKTDVGYAKMGVYLTNELKVEYPWLREVHSKVLQQSLINLDIAYKNFFRKGGVGFQDLNQSVKIHNHAGSQKMQLEKLKETE